MLVSLMRAMKPKILESFKDYNAQKEFIAKINENKNLLVVLNSTKNIIEKPQDKSINMILDKNTKIIIYNTFLLKQSQKNNI